ncbi:unnamed protein product [Rotaria socialis]
MKIIAKTNFNRTILIWLFERILCVYVLSKAMFTILNQVALILELTINSRFKQLFSQRFISIQIEINSNIPTL